jgi:hypothetical protein
MYCSYCDWDYPTDPSFELDGKATCPGCGQILGLRKSREDDGYHETGFDAAESDVILNDMANEDQFDW